MKCRLAQIQNAANEYAIRMSTDATTISHRANGADFSN